MAKSSLNNAPNMIQDSIFGDRFSRDKINSEDNYHSNKLILQIKNGDEKAFNELFYNYRGMLFNFIKLSLPDEAEIENIVQEVFVRIWINRQSLDHQKEIKPFLYSIAKNLIKDQLRKHLIRQKYLQKVRKEEIPVHYSISNELEYSELKESIDAFIERMPEQRKNIFLLSRNEGKTYKQISEQLGVSENTVDTQIRRALNGLRKIILKTTIWLFF